MAVWVETAIILLLTLANALFAGAEIAILSVRKSRLRELNERGVAAATAVLRLREQPEQFMATVQVGITLIGTTAAAFGGVTVGHALAGGLVALGVSLDVADDIALAVVIGAVTYLSVVLGELVPKSLALRSGERFALLAGRPLHALSRVVRPLVWALTASANVILRPFRDRTMFTESRFSKEELQQLLDEAATAGTVQRRAADIASRALDFQHVRVNALMVPRQEMVRIDRNATWEQAWRVLVERGHTRVLVSDGDPDHIVGYITVRDLIVAQQTNEPSMRSIIRGIDAVPEAAHATDVLSLMQREQSLIVLVVDEHGGVSGLVTLEDLLEELVGEILEEHETKTPRVRRQGPGCALVDATTPVHEVNRELGLALPTSPDWATLGGLVVARAGALPGVGATLDMEEETRIEVLEATERRVVLARITWTAHTPTKESPL
jgi:putative hemolysin